MYKPKYVSVDTLKRWAESEEPDSATRFYRQRFVKDVEKTVDTVDAIEIGREYWIDRFEIQIKGWSDADDNTVKTSFVVNYKEENDADI